MCMLSHVVVIYDRVTAKQEYANAVYLGNLKKQLLIYWIWNAFSYFNNFSFKTCQKSCPSPGVAWCRDSGVLLLCCLSGCADGSGELQQIQQQLLQVSLLKGRHHHIYCFFFLFFFKFFDTFGLSLCPVPGIVWHCAVWTVPPVSLQALLYSQCWDSWLRTLTFHWKTFQLVVR